MRSNVYICVPNAHNKLYVLVVKWNNIITMYWDSLYDSTMSSLRRIAVGTNTNIRRVSWPNVSFYYMCMSAASHPQQIHGFTHLYPLCLHLFTIHHYTHGSMSIFLCVVYSKSWFLQTKFQYTYNHRTESDVWIIWHFKKFKLTHHINVNNLVIRFQKKYIFRGPSFNITIYEI